MDPEAPDESQRLIGQALGGRPEVVQLLNGTLLVVQPILGKGEEVLVEPLSARELEVLGLIAAGLSNREIAGWLFIAVGTVKRHIYNIYGKLQVRRRTEAIARARDLGLLS